MFCSILAANDFSDIHFCKKLIIYMSVGREHSKRATKQNKYIQNKRDIKIPMFKMKF